MQNEKEEIKLFLIADNMIIYAENPNEFNKRKQKLLSLILVYQYHHYKAKFIIYFYRIKLEVES